MHIKHRYFAGASALHLAIAYNNNELVQDLIEAGANVNQRAIGKNDLFFLVNFAFIDKLFIQVVFFYLVINKLDVRLVTLITKD